MYPNGEVQWNFMQMDFESYSQDMFTGVYDNEEGTLYNAGFAIDAVSSYSGDFSGNGEFELVESLNQNIGLDLDNVADSSFTGNSIRAAQWVYGAGLENVSFNDNDSGNTYYLLNGDGAWTILDIIDSTGNGYADSGANRPFSEAMLGTAYWEGEGQDAYPGTALRQRQRASSGGSVFTRAENLRKMGKTEDAEQLEKDFKQVFEKETPTIESLMKKIAELQALLAKLQGKSVTPTDIPENCKATVLRQGMRNDCVQTLQQILGVQPQSGFFGPITRTAIQNHQRSKGLQADGIVGGLTWDSF
jgi:peptidoglycan hydrolase-like protein with peptidoglycan-binding domain